MRKLCVFPILDNSGNDFPPISKKVQFTMWQLNSYMFSNLLLHLFTEHECKVVIYLLRDNRTRLEDHVMTHIIPDLSFPLMTYNDNVDMSNEANEYGKACITSFSELSLKKLEFRYRRKRPIKILLNKLHTLGFHKPDYEPAIIESPPLISLKRVEHSSSIMIVSTACPEIEQPHVKSFYMTTEVMDLPKCVPDLSVSHL